ncbi:MAG: hypothetical protein IT328_26360 [Caldilineaceae bacterium]|nr:hypothetical protein [Caldilineaceae bacterium]
MQCQHPIFCRSTSVLPTWQRTALFLCILVLTLTVLTMFNSGYPVHARDAVGRRDRRPDREVRIRYPQPQRPSSADQGNRPTLQRASTAPTVAPSTPTDATQAVPTANE